MATLEDKILGNKTHSYCSSSSESEDENSGKEDQEEGNTSQRNEQQSIPPLDPYKWEGSSTNTGPKGVVKDWQRYKQLEVEKREEQEKERLQLYQKLSLTCRTALQDEQDKLKEEGLSDFLNDDFLLEYQKRRMNEMISQASNLPTFGKVVSLIDRKSFLEAVDDENKSVTVVIHLYEDNVPGCEAMNGCLSCLSNEFPQIKFCKLKASAAGMSDQFKSGGVPALLVYKGGQVVGNFVRISDELGDDFYADEVESFLSEHGVLPDKTCVPSLIGNIQNEDNDSDLSLE